MRTRKFIPLLLSAIISLNGCVILPIPTTEGKRLAGSPVSEEQLACVVPNLTMKKEVVERLGSPIHIWEDGQVFSYNWVVRQGVLVVALPGGAGDISDIPKQYVVLIQFDEQDRVRRFEKVVPPKFNSYDEYEAFVREWAEIPINIAPRPNSRNE